MSERPVGWIAASDQALASVETFAAATATYYGTLVQRGVPRALAAQFTHQWLQLQFQMAMWRGVSDT